MPEKPEKQKPFDFFSALISEGRQIYAILDAAADSGIPKKLWWLDADYVSLYKGEPEEKYFDIAPYLVNISINGENHAKLREWIFEKCWGGGRAVFFEANADMNTLLKHFQKFTIVLDESGKGMFFRFYDPRVLRVYLPTCNKEESRYIYGYDIIKAFFVESGEGDRVLSFLPKQGYFVGDDVHAPRILVIRKAQMAAFKKEMLNKFCSELKRHFRRRFPNYISGMTGTQLNDFLFEGLEYAKNCGIDDQNDVKRFFEYFVRYGHDFGKTSDTVWANSILNNNELSGNMKMNQIDDYDLFVVESGKGNHNVTM